MSGILFLAHRIPFPPDRGDKIRSHHLLKALANFAPVHVGCLGENAADKAAEVELAGVAASHCMPMRTKPLPLAGIEALAAGRPVSLMAFHHQELARWVRHTLANSAIDTIYVFSGQMGQYVPKDWAGRLIVDLVDVDSAKFEAYAQESTALMQWAYAREGRLLQVEEARLTSKAAQTLLVSEAEAELLTSRLPSGVQGNISALGNGIDGTAFDPARIVPNDELNGTGPTILFTGQMDYPPNAEAALRVIDRIMPMIQGTVPGARFHVVGRAAGRELVAREGKHGTRVWGEVPDVRPFLAAADLVLTPLTIARGVQNKVLEAMAMARPVVLTSTAATGLPGVDRVHFAVADTDEAIAHRAISLLTNAVARARMGSAARDIVLRERNWPAMLAGLPAIVGRPQDSGRRCRAA